METPIVFDVATADLPSGPQTIYRARVGLLSLTAPFAFSPGIRPSTMFLVSIRPTPAARPLVVVADLSGLCVEHNGVSATNAAERVVHELGPLVAQMHACEASDLDWVALDSEGQFDRWWPSRSGVEFQPLLAPAGSGLANRSKEAFKASYPKAGHELFLHLLQMTLTDSMPSTPAAVLH